MGVWKVVDFGICFNRRSSNVQQKGGQGLVGILLRTLTNISLDILVSHGLDITHHLHQAVRLHFAFVSIFFVYITISSIIPFNTLLTFMSQRFWIVVNSFISLLSFFKLKNTYHIIPYHKLHILSRHEVDTKAKGRNSHHNHQQKGILSIGIEPKECS